MKILIVDDDSISRKVLRKNLAKYGHCDIATDGDDALWILEQSLSEDDPYDLVTMDVNMPNLNGIEALKKIRSLEEKYNIFGLDVAKILMVTASEKKEIVMNSFKSGCEGYLIKPFDQNQIKKTLKEIFK